VAAQEVRGVEPSETSYDDGGGGGPTVVTVRIKLVLEDDTEALRASQGHTRTARCGGFWTGVLIALTLIFMGVL
jgi:hypothetical protein